MIFGGEQRVRLHTRGRAVRLRRRPTAVLAAVALTGGGVLIGGASLSAGSPLATASGRSDCARHFAPSDPRRLPGAPDAVQPGRPAEHDAPRLRGPGEDRRASLRHDELRRLLSGANAGVLPRRQRGRASASTTCPWTPTCTSTACTSRPPPTTTTCTSTSIRASASPTSTRSRMTRTQDPSGTTPTATCWSRRRSSRVWPGRSWSRGGWMTSWPAYPSGSW